jgi:hypothetical protein
MNMFVHVFVAEPVFSSAIHGLAQSLRTIAQWSGWCPGLGSQNSSYNYGLSSS